MAAVMVISMLLTLAAIALVTGLVFWRREEPRLPPGSLGFPVVGEALSLLGRSTRDFIADRLVKHGPVFKTSLFGAKTVVLPAPEGNRLILMGENKLVRLSMPDSVKTILGKGSLVSKTGDDHRRSRRHLMSFLGPEMLQKQVGAASKIAREHLETHWKAKSEEILLVYPLVKKFMLSLACFLLVGLDAEGLEMDLFDREFETMKKGLFQLPIDFPGTAFRRGKRARKHLDKLLDKHIQRRRASISSNEGAGIHHDLLTMLLTTRDENDELSSDSDIKDSIVTLLFAGHETSSVALTWVFKYLAENPGCMEKVVQENMGLVNKEAGELSWDDLRKLKYTWQVMQETMRLKTPVGGGFREAIQDVEFQQYVIPKGWKLMWSKETSYEKEEYFPEPLRFDPSRFDKELVSFTYLPFGAGARMCPGLEFARMEMLVFLHYFIASMSWTLVDSEEGFVCDPMPRPVKGMQIRVCVKESKDPILLSYL